MLDAVNKQEVEFLEASASHATHPIQSLRIHPFRPPSDSQNRGKKSPGSSGRWYPTVRLFVSTDSAVTVRSPAGIPDFLGRGSSYHVGIYVFLQIRSETIATYALCGFANFGSLGIVIGGLSK